MAMVLVTSLVLLAASALAQPDSVSYYVSGIEDAINVASTYSFPTNADEYKPNERFIKDFGTFDFIVVGAGASGAVVANRLTENPKWSVLVLEAGNFSTPIVDIPGMATPDFTSVVNWGYMSTPQTTSCQDCPTHQIVYSAGRGVGGSTLINTMAYLRGTPVYYDQLGQTNPGWCFKDVLPYFKKSENITATDPLVLINPTYHGTSGPLSVQFRTPRHPTVDYYLRANQELGYDIVDANSNTSIGTGVMPYMVKDGVRAHTGAAYIEPVLHRGNLHVLTQSYATRVLISPITKHSRGVQFVYRGQTYRAYAKEEVVLAAGSIKSAQLLMLSGVGPRKHLERFKIPVVSDLEVGSKLLDQPAYRALFFSSNYTKSGQNLTEFVEEYLEGESTLTTPLENNAFTFLQSNLTTTPNDPDIELTLAAIDGFVNYSSRYLPDKTFTHLNSTQAGFYIVIVVQKTDSFGTLRLNSSSAYDFPLIDSNYYTDPLGKDIEIMYQGVQKALELAKTKAFQEIAVEYIRQEVPECDGEEYLSRAYWMCCIRAYTTHIDHQMGTCPMGPDPRKGAVVNARAQVHGVKRLRVVDASIFPATFSGHPTSHCVMAAEKLSDVIKKAHS